ncbi:peroxiredoxin [Armatimonas rosea]|uniref:Peroxiredoxin n=2 Tax=Armatimonas rosea TaxID=685828 RepID=A0A7W9STF1_ARMRO|nr:peroxiredoxin [Armatimonas rosea]
MQQMPPQTERALPDLTQVYARIAKLRGVVIRAEMVRPSSVPMEFKIAPTGFFYAKYPTSEMYISRDEQVTWMPAKKEFSRGKPEDGNPLPAGFEILWPKGALLRAKAATRQASFAGKPALELPCKAAMGHDVLLYIHPESLLPLGSIATAQGTEYELRYLSVEERPLTARDLTFIAPRDAKVFSSPPDLSKRIRVGTKLPAFTGTDFTGRSIDSRQVSKRHRGLLLNFWFSACTGCIQEMPLLAKLAAPLQAQKIGILGVNPIDTSRDAKRTSTTYGLRYATLVGTGARKLAEAVGITTYPVTVLVNAQGLVVEVILGFDEQRLQKALKVLGYRSR